MPLTISRDRLEALVNAASRTRIVVVGDAMLDEYLVGDVERISPEAPVPVVHVRERRYALGGAANVAHNVAALGGRVEIAGLVGSDEPATRLLADLARIGIDTASIVTDPSRSQIRTTRRSASRRPSGW